MTNFAPSGFLYVLLFYLLALSGCARIPVEEVQYTYDPEINYRTFRTFGWYKAEVPTPMAGGAGPQYSSLVDDRVKGAVASELVKKGLNPMVEGTPDLLVAYDIAVDSAQRSGMNGNVPTGYGYWYGYRYRYSHTGVPNYKEIQKYSIGTLIIDLIDPDTNQLIWRGWVSSDINPAALDDTYIPVVVANIMSRFPPTTDITR
ncbi:DUF4136 domain-containing protein [Pontibacter sp. E15-1]|uniref:DUF4136 domain-containing protein n=1 Tax=Pontibacter sp. E15-1 TaxID=2919918 RepID=UPI001F4FDCFD|nr:DUF4136 domain-containing protein [Pontibacter sp. E15-1]MCJ8166073.1 DUF4136 domain-containing protein [Pontibacter sp. E15-1]